MSYSFLLYELLGRPIFLFSPAFTKKQMWQNEIFRVTMYL